MGVRDAGTVPAIAAEFAGGLLTRRQAIGRLAVLGVGLTSATTLLAACEPKPKPNIVLIIVDDMRYEHVQYMPNVQNLIQVPGRTFTQARCNVALCQSSRVGLMTGQMSKHNNDVSLDFFSTTLTDNDNCLGKWMHDAGYRCGYFGKYVNYWDNWAGGIDAPAGYDTWRETIGNSNPYDFDVHLETGTTHVAGTYETDYLAGEVANFVTGSQPFFCVVAPRQPHAPYDPRADLVEAWSNLEVPIVDEVDVSDKPNWIKNAPPMTEEIRAQIVEGVRGALRELSAADDMVGQIVASIAPMLPNTIVAFTSDNGVYQGEHRRFAQGSKSGPYDVALRVPMLVRGPGFTPGPEVTAPVMPFQDLTATLLKAAKATAGLPNQAGISLRDILANPAAQAQRELLHEIGGGFYIGVTGDGVTTGSGHPLGFRKLFRYPSVRVKPAGPFVYEAYDLDTDPDELTNWANDPARRPERNALEARLNALLA